MKRLHSLMLLGMAIAGSAIACGLTTPSSPLLDFDAG